MLDGREGDQFLDQIVEPGSFLRQPDAATFEGGGLGVEAHDLVALGRAAPNRIVSLVAQILNELRAGGAVFDKNHGRPILVRRLLEHTLELGILHLPAHQVQQIEARTLDAPDREDRVVGKLADLVRAIDA
jgi:hypothetical protein